MKTLFIAIGVALFGFVLYCAWFVVEAVGIYRRMS